MNDDFLNPQVNESTEGLSVTLPELRDAPIGHRVTFMVGTLSLVFEVSGHTKGETQLIRVRNAKGR